MAVIIDSLTHVTPNGQWFATPFDASENRLLREMDETGVDKAVVVALAGYIENNFVAEVCRRHPQRLIPGASINPAAYSTPKRAAVEAKALLNENFAVIKLHPRLNKYDLTDLRTIAMLESVAKCAKPPLIWLDTFLRYKGCSMAKPPVETIFELVSQFPNLTFVLLHAGGLEALRIADAARDYTNVFIDISYTMRRYKGSSVEIDLRYLIRSFDRRIIFGSDFPELSIREALDDFNALALEVGKEPRKRILGNNLKGLLGI